MAAPDFPRRRLVGKFLYRALVRVNAYKYAKFQLPITVSQYSTVVLTVVRVMIAKYRKSGIWGYRSSLTPEPVELK